MGTSQSTGALAPDGRPQILGNLSAALLVCRPAGRKCSAGAPPAAAVRQAPPSAVPPLPNQCGPLLCSPYDIAGPCNCTSARLAALPSDSLSWPLPIRSSDVPHPQEVNPRAEDAGWREETRNTPPDQATHYRSVTRP